MGWEQMKIVVSIMMFMGAIVSAALYADDRYAHQATLSVYIEDAKIETRMAADVLRKQLLEDKVYEFDLIPDDKKTDNQRALSNRYRTQLQDVQNRINGRPQQRDTK
jgi:hypothetical protein